MPPTLMRLMWWEFAPSASGGGAAAARGRPPRKTREATNLGGFPPGAPGAARRPRGGGEGGGGGGPPGRTDNNRGGPPADRLRQPHRERARIAAVVAHGDERVADAGDGGHGRPQRLGDGRVRHDHAAQRLTHSPPRGTPVARASRPCGG